MNRLRAVTIVAATLALAAPSPVAGSVARSNATFTARAERACADAGAQVTKLPKVTSSNVLDTADKEIAIVVKLVKRLKAIRAPTSKAARYRSLIKLTEQQARQLRSGIGDIRKGEVARGEALINKADAAGKHANKVAAQLTLPACAKDYTAKG